MVEFKYVYVRLKYHWTSQWIYNLVILIFWKFILFLLINDDDAVRSQFCTCHDSYAVVAYANLWPDSIIEIKSEL